MVLAGQNRTAACLPTNHCHRMSSSSPGTPGQSQHLRPSPLTRRHRDPHGIHLGHHLQITSRLSLAVQQLLTNILVKSAAQLQVSVTRGTWGLTTSTTAASTTPTPAPTTTATASLSTCPPRERIRDPYFTTIDLSVVQLESFRCRFHRIKLQKGLASWFSAVFENGNSNCTNLS